MPYQQAFCLVAACALSLVSSAAAQLPPNAFDLADACRGGDGTFPGSGTMDEYPINSGQSFVPAPANYTYVVGTFAVLDSGPTFLTDPAGPNPIQFDFGSYVGATSSNGGPANGLGNGGLAINDPSLVGANPDYTGDPSNHSIMMCHASVGITFDLNAIRGAFPAADWFVANAGSSCNSAGYVVLVDGEVRAAGEGLSGSAFHQLTIPILPTDQYLTLASTDSNLGTINCAHAFFGDPWLVPTTVGPAYGSMGGGCANPTTGVPILDNQLGSEPAIGTSFVIELTNTPTLAGVMALSFGFTAVPIPLPPGFLALTNCTTNVVPDGIGTAIYSNGLGSFSIAIPANPSLAGLEFFNQAAALDLQGNDGLSNANRAIIR